MGYPLKLNMWVSCCDADNSFFLLFIESQIINVASVY